MRIIVLLAIATVSAAPSAALAHHSIAPIYDTAATATITGRLTKVEFVAPHVRFEVRVSDENGGSELWKLESRSPNGMERAGLTAGALPIGSTVEFTGSPGRDGSRTMWPSFLKVDGAKTYDFRRRPSPATPDGAR